MKSSADCKIARMPARIVCQYANQSEQIQIVCIAGSRGVSFEKTVMPQQQVVFEAPSESVLEVRTGSMVTAIASDRIPCIRLRRGLSADKGTDKSEGLEKPRTKRKKAARKRASKRTSPVFKQLSA